MRNKYGPGIFWHLSRDPALRPEATQLLDRVTAVLRKHDQDPAFLDSLIDGLQGNPGDRDTSIEMLRNIGPTVVPRILQRLAVPKRGDEPGLFVQALAQMGEQMVPVLCGALESTNDSLRDGAIQALGLIGSKRAVPYLLDPAFDLNQPKGIRAAARTVLARILSVPTERGDGVSAFGAQTDLKKQAQLALANRMSWPTTEGKTDLWTWNDESKTLERHSVAPPVASLYAGLRFARQALSMAPEDRQAQVLFLALQFAWSARGSLEGGAVAVSPLPGGREAPLDLVLTAGPEVTSGTLALGEVLGNPAVEIGAIRALAAVGAHEEIYGARRSRSPLLAALDNPNPEVQYAAAVAILRANPETPFRGARRVVEVLTRAISGPSSPVAVVIDTNRVGGNDMAGFLSQIGFEPIIATTGRQGFEMAVRQSNVVLIAVEANVIRWPLSQTVSNLRADARMPQVPILVYGPESVRSEIPRHARALSADSIHGGVGHSAERRDAGGGLFEPGPGPGRPSRQPGRAGDRCHLMAGLDRQRQPHADFQHRRRRVGPDGHFDGPIGVCQRARRPWRPFPPAPFSATSSNWQPASVSTRPSARRRPITS